MVRCARSAAALSVQMVGRVPARVTQTLVVLVLAQRGIFAIESALATKGDEIGVAQQPNGLALFLDDQVRRTHLGNHVVNNARLKLVAKSHFLALRRF